MAEDRWNAYAGFDVRSVDSPAEAARVISDLLDISGAFAQKLKDGGLWEEAPAAWGGSAAAGNVRVVAGAGKVKPPASARPAPTPGGSNKGPKGGKKGSAKPKPKPKNKNLTKLGKPKKPRATSMGPTASPKPKPKPKGNKASRVSLGPSTAPKPSKPKPVGSSPLAGGNASWMNNGPPADDGGEPEVVSSAPIKEPIIAGNVAGLRNSLFGASGPVAEKPKPTPPKPVGKVKMSGAVANMLGGGPATAVAEPAPTNPLPPPPAVPAVPDNDGWGDGGEDWDATPADGGDAVGIGGEEYYDEGAYDDGYAEPVAADGAAAAAGGEWLSGRVMFDFAGDGSGDPLQVPRAVDELLWVQSDPGDDNWYLCEDDQGVSGVIPKNYVEIVPS